MYFRYHQDILDTFPDICGGVTLADNVQNRPTPPALLDIYVAEQTATLARIDSPLAEVPSLSAWRGAFRRFGVNPTKYRSATEALLRRLTKKGDIPSINTLVDIGNLVSIRYALPVAMFDLRSVADGVTVRFADGHERFTELGNDRVIHPEPGEVVFTDATDMVVARRWCWRQSAESASRADTTDILVTVEAQHSNGRVDIEAAVADLEALLAQFTGASCRSAILDVQQSSHDSS
jgi:DNA/RNA-binding domain of Phe-tRNA-synthetase-like protein